MKCLPYISAGNIYSEPPHSHPPPEPHSHPPPDHPCKTRMRSLIDFMFLHTKEQIAYKNVPSEDSSFKR